MYAVNLRYIEDYSFKTTRILRYVSTYMRIFTYIFISKLCSDVKLYVYYYIVQDPYN